MINCKLLTLLLLILGGGARSTSTDFCYMVLVNEAMERVRVAGTPKKASKEHAISDRLFV